MPVSDRKRSSAVSTVSGKKLLKRLQGLGASVRIGPARASRRCGVWVVKVAETKRPLD
ncbi:MAG: hypothetical protein PVI98_07120 [Burkholderiales bacterium]